MATSYPGGPPAPGAAPHQSPGGPGTANVPDSYFTESRKGEINELRNLLRAFGTERDPQRKRDIIKKVIAYMTLGIDVSRLFSEMMLAIETRDLVIKKMVYLYLTNYARTHPELAQMCTNTLQKDCGNDDPMVRGLALRALCGLQLPQMVEYIAEPLRRSLQDGHAYVRKTGVMGILKLYHLDPESFETSGFVDILYDMLRDPDASVVCNCIIVLNEVMQKSPNGGMAINRAIMLHLLNRIVEFNEFAKVQVLELVPRYIPANEEEGFQIMNLLDPVLRSSSPAAVMATVKAFMSLADHVVDMTGDASAALAMKRQIVERVKPCLVTQISAGSSEQMYTLLKHFKLLAEVCPGVLDDEYRQFYVRYNEPTHVQFLKVEILPQLANPDTAPDIVTELAELVHNSTHVNLAKAAVRSMAKIATAHDRGGPGAVEAIARRLVELLDLNMEYVSAEAASALALIVRTQEGQGLKALLAPPLVRALKYMSEPNGKASLVFLLAECSEETGQENTGAVLIPEAPYALEKLIDSYDDQALPVKSALLSATVRLFFQQPAQCQRMLGRLLQAATNDVSSQNLHDRALLYYRMLRNGNPHDLERIVAAGGAAVNTKDHFAEDFVAEDLKALMEEFDSLTVIYGKPSTNFIDLEYQVKYVKMPPEHPLAPGAEGAAPPPDIMATNDPASGAPVDSAPIASAPAPPPAGAPAEMDLLGGFDSYTGDPPAPAPAPVGDVGLALSPSMSMSGDEYQNHWGSINDAEAIVSMVPLPRMPADAGSVERALASHYIQTMASGELPTEFKFFLYAQAQNSGELFLIQSNIDKSSSQEPLMIVTVKLANAISTANPQGLTDQLMGVMTKALS
mmetsp:Transcript_18127/g.49459  ORF Transcript_18127/g.49459 Transcript_18127/m.49459 type:complete len:854 (+) Transcript_18127:342-2903(+)